MILIAVVTCHRFRHRADTQRQTWVPLCDADVRFFLGGGTAQRPDEIILDAGDDYRSLPHKVRAMFQWALDNDYDWAMKTDDDVYLVPARLLASDFRHNYTGPMRGEPGEGFMASYASGFAYWVSRRSMEILAKAEIHDWAEDRWVGNTLADAGIACYPDYRYTVIHSPNSQNPLSGTEGPLASNDVIGVAELPPEMMRRIHLEWSGQEVEAVAR